MVQNKKVQTCKEIKKGWDDDMILKLFKKVWTHLAWCFNLDTLPISLKLLLCMLMMLYLHLQVVKLGYKDFFYHNCNLGFVKGNLQARMSIKDVMGNFFLHTCGLYMCPQWNGFWILWKGIHVYAYHVI
jgi:hypothetical protein